MKKIKNILLLSLAAILIMVAPSLGQDTTTVSTPSESLSVFAFLSQNKGVILGALFGISELLAFIPKVKANSIFQLIFGVLKSKTGN